MRPEVRQLMNQARQAAQAGSFDVAEDACARAIAADPKFPGGYITLGALAHRAGRIAESIGHMGDALKLDPTNATALDWLAMLHLEVGNVPEAMKYAHRALEADPRAARPLDTLAKCHFVGGRWDEALAFIDAAIASDPEPLARQFARMAILCRLDRHSEAAKPLRRLVGRAPSEDGFLMLAEVEQKLGRLVEALDCTQKALDMSPKSHDAHRAMARLLAESGLQDQADLRWDQAMSLDPKPEEVCLERAFSLIAQGRFEAALAELNKSIEIEPRQGRAYTELVSSKRIGEADRPLVRQMESILSENGLTDDQRLNLHYALGKAYDNLDDLKEAMHHFDKANSIKFELQPSRRSFDGNALVGQVNARIENFTGASLACLRASANPSALPILVVGMMRSGTTLVEQILSCHPSVGGAGEQPFWQLYDDLRPEAPGLRERADEYVALLSQIAPGFPHVIDKNPANIFSAGLIHAALPNARILHTKRSPVDTALSIWTTPMRTSANFVCNRENIVFSCREYLRIAQHWRSVLPQDRYLEVEYEGLVTNPEPEVRRILEFCGLEWHDSCLHPELNARAVKTPSHWQVRQPFYKTSLNRWKRYEPWLGAFRELLTETERTEQGAEIGSRS